MLLSPWICHSYQNPSENITYRNTYALDKTTNNVNNVYYKITHIETKELDENMISDNCKMIIITNDGRKYDRVYYKDHSKIKKFEKNEKIQIKEPSIYEKFESNCEKNEIMEGKNEVKTL